MKRKAWAVHHFWSTNEPNGYRRGTNQNGFAVIQEVLAQELAQVETSRRLPLDRIPQGHPTEKRLIGLAFFRRGDSQRDL